MKRSERRDRGRQLIDAVLVGDAEAVCDCLRRGASIEFRDAEHDETPLVLNMARPLTTQRG